MYLTVFYIDICYLYIDGKKVICTKMKKGRLLQMKHYIIIYSPKIQLSMQELHVHFQYFTTKMNMHVIFVNFVQYGF